MKTAILVIDLQQGLIEDSGKPFDFENVIQRVNAITTHARKCQWPVILIQHETVEGNWKYGNTGWPLLPELQAGSNDFRVRKTTPNSFHKTELDEILKNNQVERVVICGYATEYCVDTTVRAAAALGYDIQIASDAHTTHDKTHASAQLIINHHNEALSGMKSFAVSIKAVPSENIILDSAVDCSH
jgi:nicotinamidase-related amidase